jgi:hypothetical protein
MKQNMKRIIIQVASALFWTAALSGQDAVTGRLAWGKELPTEAPVAEPGDTIIIDSVGGDIVATSRGHKRTVVRRTHTEPRFTVRYRTGQKDTEYSFSLANGTGAKQPIETFFFELPDGITITEAVSPAKWEFLGVSPKDLAREPRAHWTRVSRDGDETGLLSAGKSAGGFRFRANAWPGLVVVRVAGMKDATPETTLSDESRQAFEGKHSPWALDEVDRLLTFRENTR